MVIKLCADDEFLLSRWYNYMISNKVGENYKLKTLDGNKSSMKKLLSIMRDDDVDWLDIPEVCKIILAKGTNQSKNLMFRYKELLEVSGKTAKDIAANVHIADCLKQCLDKHDQRAIEKKQTPCCASTCLMIHAFEYHHLCSPYCSEAFLTLMAIELRLCFRGGFFDKTILVDSWPEDIPTIDLPDTTLDHQTYCSQLADATKHVVIPELDVNYLVCTPNHRAIFIVTTHKTSRHSSYRFVLAFSPLFTEYLQRCLISHQPHRSIIMGKPLIGKSDELKHIWGVTIPQIRQANMVEGKMADPLTCIDMCRVAAHSVTMAYGKYDRPEILSVEAQRAKFDEQFKIPQTFTMERLYRYENAIRWIKHAIIEDNSWGTLMAKMREATDDNVDDVDDDLEPEVPIVMSASPVKRKRDDTDEAPAETRAWKRTMSNCINDRLRELDEFRQKLADIRDLLQ